jgi:hypothetical protein
MPSYNNAELLAQKIADCNSELDSLFAYLDINYRLRMQLRDIKSFYQRAFNNASNENTAMEIINQYEQFIVSASEVKLGQMTVEEANLVIDDATEDRQFKIIVHNIFKLCELFFWTALAATAYAGCITVGIPLLFLEPLIGVALTIGTGLLCCSSFHNGLECFNEFKTFDRANEENTRERDVISFFAPQPSQRAKVTTQENDLDLSEECFMSSCFN